MDDLISTLAWILITYWAIKITLRINDVVSTNKDIEERIKAHLEKIVHSVDIETHDGVHYWYDKDDGSFLAQGQGMDEIIVALKARFPQHIFLINDEEWMSASTDWKLSKDLGEIEKLQISI